MTYNPGSYHQDHETTTRIQLQNLGVADKDLRKITKTLDPNGTRDALTSSQFVQLAKQLQKLKGYDLTQPDTVDWTSFISFVSRVYSGSEQITCDKLKEFIKYFAGMGMEKAKEFATGIYNTAMKIYNSMSISAFCGYLTKGKILTATAAMTQVEQTVSLYEYYDNKLRTFYSLCFSEYESEILEHVKDNEILNIKPYHLNHVLGMLAELSELVEKTKKEYTKLMNNYENKIDKIKKNMKNEDIKFKKSCDKYMKTSVGIGTAGGILGLVGLCLTPICWPFAIAAGAGLLIAGGSTAVYYHNKDQRENETSEKYKNLKNNLEKCEKELKKLNEKNVLQHLNELAENIKEFEEQVKQIKKQYKIKKNLKNNDQDIALWLAKQRKQENNERKVQLYRDILRELDVDNFESTIELNNKNIDKVFENEMKQKYNYRDIELDKAKTLIKKYFVDSNIIQKYKFEKLNIRS